MLHTPLNIDPIAGCFVFAAVSGMSTIYRFSPQLNTQITILCQFDASALYPNQGLLEEAYVHWTNFSNTFRDEYYSSSLVFTPVPQSQIDVSNANGGTAFSPPDGQCFWVSTSCVRLTFWYFLQEHSLSKTFRVSFIPLHIRPPESCLLLASQPTSLPLVQNYLQGLHCLLDSESPCSCLTFRQPVYSSLIAEFHGPLVYLYT